MRVLVAHNYYQQAGGEDGVFRDECDLLERSGDAVLRLAVSNDEIDGTGIIARARMAGGTIWSRRTTGQVRRMVREFRPDVIHVHNTLPLLSPSIYHAARSEGVAVVQTLHNYRMLCAGALLFRDGGICEDCVGKPRATAGIRHRCYRGSAAASAAVASSTAIHWSIGTWTRKVNRYVAMTEFGKSRFVRGGVPEERIIVKPHFVRDAPPPGGDVRKDVLFVGRLTRDKGVHTLLDAWRGRQTGMRLIVVGDGPEREAVLSAAAESGTIEYLGSKPPAEVLSLMRSAAAVIVPSLWYETFGRVVTEAYAVATPVIASDIGALAELVEDGTTGFLFPPGDAAALRARIELMASPESARRMGGCAYERYKRLYTPEANYPQLIAVYQAAIRDARSTRRGGPTA